MVSIKHFISLVIALSALCYTFFTVGKLILFLSSPQNIQSGQTWIINLMDNKSKLETAFSALVLDMILVILFILQHSLMKSAIFQSIIHKMGFGTAERALYCLASSACLYYLMDNWRKAPTFVLWQIDISKNSYLWWIFILIHALAWIIIYGGSIIMDLPDIIGIKQIYYDMKGFAPPMAYKSFELRHLYGHVRHPSFIGLSTILWATNIMSMDRLLLALMFTLYMYVGWSTDYNDAIYHKCQLQRKRTELRNLN